MISSLAVLFGVYSIAGAIYTLVQVGKEEWTVALVWVLVAMFSFGVAAYRSWRLRHPRS